MTPTETATILRQFNAKVSGAGTASAGMISWAA